MARNKIGIVAALDEDFLSGQDLRTCQMVDRVEKPSKSLAGVPDRYEDHNINPP